MPKVLPDPTPEQLTVLKAVRRAAKARQAADRQYRDAIAAAAGVGLTATQICGYTGTTYQAVQQILART